jgi:hypothetical protein
MNTRIFMNQTLVEKMSALINLITLFSNQKWNNE